jgi:aspartate/methionine/tyrosine aminotransferase
VLIGALICCAVAEARPLLNAPYTIKIQKEKQMISKRINEITSFIVMDVLERAHEMERKGVRVIHLEVGEPDFDTPACIKEAACKALEGGYTHYTHSLGLLELREAICECHFKTYNVSIDPGQVVVSSGTSPAMFLIFAVLLEKGDQVIISDPHYACYPNFIKFLESESVTIPVYEEDGFQYRPEAIKEKITEKTKAIFINSPSNPTGNLLSESRMKDIAALKYADDDVARMKQIYNKRRQFIIRRLKEIGFRITVEPTGAFYVFANAKHISNDSYRLAFDILENAHVGVAPGIDFGKNGEGYLRFSYANSMENIAEGMDRLESYLNKLN